MSLSSLFSSPRALALLWLGAFVCALFPINEFQLEFYAGCIVLIFTWGAIALSRDAERGWNVPRTPVLLFGGLFWLLVACSLFWSEVKPVSIMGLAFFSVFPLSFFVWSMTGREEAFTFAVRALGVIFAVLSLWAMFQFFFLNAYFMGQARHPLADPSSLGALFSLAFFCSLGVVVSDAPARTRKAAVILSTLLLCGIVATAARGPVFALIPGLGLFVALLWPQVRARGKTLLLIAAVVAAFYALTQTGIQKKYDMGERLFGTVSMEMENPGNNRLSIWRSALEAGADHPWLGTGIGTFFLYYPEHRTPEQTDTVFLAHSDPLQFWTELGVLGPILFYAFVIAAAVRSFRALARLKAAGRVQERILVAAIFTALAAMVAHSHVAFNHYNLTILMISGFLLAVWLGATARALGEPEHIVAIEGVAPAVRKAIIVLPFIMIGWLALSVSAGEYFVNKARDNLFKEDMFAFAENINNAGRVSMGMNFRAYLLAVNVPMAILGSEGVTQSESAQKNLYEQITGYMDRVLALNPRDSSARYYLGKVQTMVAPGIVPEGTPSPEEYYRQAIALDPMHLGARLELYKICTGEKRAAEECLAVLQAGENFYYSTPIAMDFYKALAQAYLLTKNYGKAQAVMNMAMDFSKQSDYSRIRQNTSIPQAIRGGDEIFKGTR